MTTSGQDGGASRRVEGSFAHPTARHRAGQIKKWETRRFDAASVTGCQGLLRGARGGS